MPERKDFCSEKKILFKELGISISHNLPIGDIAPVECYKSAPTLLELRKIGILSLEKKITLESERGEWTADFIDFSHHIKQDGGHILCEYVSRPERIEKIGNQWFVYGGERFQISLPPSGWVMPDEEGKLYDDRTGTPLRTMNGDESIMEIAVASKASFFWRTDLEDRDLFIAINRECERWDGDAFEISIIQAPDFSHDNIGVRCIERE